MDRKFVEYCIKNHKEILSNIGMGHHVVEDKYEKFCQLFETYIHSTNFDFSNELIKTTRPDENILKIIYNISLNDTFLVCRTPAFIYENHPYSVQTYKLDDNFNFYDTNLLNVEKSKFRKLLKEKISKKYKSTFKAIVYVLNVHKIANLEYNDFDGNAKKSYLIRAVRLLNN